MIFFVDEDFHLYDPWIEKMRQKDYAVEPLWNANHAYRRLHAQPREDVELTIIDVMLAVGGMLDAEHEQFSYVRTQGYLETGLRLLDDLVRANPRVYPKRAVLLTNAFGKETLTAAQETRDRYGIELWAKSSFVGEEGAQEFADRVDDLIQRLRDEADDDDAA
ncbi:MAG: hypothetical protein WBC33_11465 [Conexibacter sp.]